MKVIVQVTIESEAGQGPVVERITCLERSELDPGTLGLTLEEAKNLLASVQQVLVTQQVADYVEQRMCAECGKQRSSKGEHSLATTMGKKRTLGALVPEFFTSNQMFVRIPPKSRQTDR